MQIINNLKVNEKLYIDRLENGLTVMIIPKKDVQKKYLILGINYGSNDSSFIAQGETEITEVPKGVAHFLEHKMFEQENGKNSLDVLTALGVNANAYTTNDHTAYLYECTDNFYEALDEFMDYIQHPYFTDENVEKEKGIIGQEIGMYDDYPEWKVYLNALEAMYHNNPVKLDITGTVETISQINKDILYKCYNTFYTPSNMAMVVCGDFEPELLIEEIKKRTIMKENKGDIKRIYPDEPENVVKNKIVQKMEVSRPLYTIGIKCNALGLDDLPEKAIRKHIAIQILMNIIFGESSPLYRRLYDSGNISYTPNMDYEFTKRYAHILLTGQANNPEVLYDEFKKMINQLKQEGIKEEDFVRIRKMIYGDYIKEYNDVTDIARMFLSDYFKGVNTFDYLEQIGTVDLQYIMDVLNQVFDENRMILSIIKP